MKTKKTTLISFIAISFFYSHISFSQFKVLSSGKVGVGTLTPVAKFHVAGDAAIFTSATGTPTTCAFIKCNNGNSSPITSDYTWFNDGGTGIFHPANNNIGFAIGGFEKMRLVNNAIYFPNDGSQAITSSALIKLTNAYSTAANPDFSWYNDGGTGIFHSSQNVIGISVAGNEKMKISNNSIDAKTQVTIDTKDNTNLISYNSFSSDYNYAQVSNVNRAYTKSWVVTYNWQERFAVWGNGICYSRQGFWSGSDVSLKENIDSISSPLEKVMSLKGRKYNFKADQLQAGDTVTILPTNAPETKFGVIAQEVETIVPEAVTTLPDGTKAVSYDNLIALLIEAVKKQQIQINQLDSRIEGCCKGKDKIKIKPRLGNGQENDEPDDATMDYKITSKLFQNNPNPFNEKTTINYFIPTKANQARILVFDMQGMLLNTYIIKEKGNGNISISGGELKSGMYLYSLIVDGNEIDTKRMILTN